MSVKDLIKTIPLTFYSRDFYRDLLRSGQGIGVRFMLIIVALDILYILFVGASPVVAIATFLPDAAAQLPVATWKDHTLSIDKPSPYVLQFHDKNGKPYKASGDEGKAGRLVVDTGYAPDNLPALKEKMKAEKILALFTAKSLVTMQRENELKVQSYNAFPDMVLTQADYLHYGHLILIFVPLIVIFFAGIASFIASFIKACLGGLFVMLVGLFTKSVPDFSAAMRLTLAAIIPVGIVFTLIPGSHLYFKMMAWAGYAIFGAFAAMKSKQV